MMWLLFALFQLFAGVLFLFLSAVLLYRRLVNRWLKFTALYAVSYAVGSWSIFGELPVFITFLAERPDFTSLFWIVLLFAGPVACVGYGLFRQLSGMQIGGMLLVYAAGLFSFFSLSGLESPIPLHSVLIGSPYVLFYVGTPILVGWMVFRGAECNRIAGALVAFGSMLVLLTVVTTMYFGVPFGLGFELSEHTKAWIALGSLALGVFGIPAVVGYGWMHAWERKTIVGAVTLFLVTVIGVASFVGLTIGYGALFPTPKP